MLRVSLLGHMTAEVDRQPLKLSPATAAMRLWAYLLLHRHESLPRKHVAFTLFPDSPESEALACVRRQLHVLQSLLPAPDGDEPWIIADRVSLQWNTNSDYRLDVEEFEARCGAPPGRPNEPALRTTEARLERALSLYSGDLLADHYDDWVLAERERLDRMHAGALAQLVSLRASHGDVRGAASAADRLVACDNLCEELHRLAMGLHYLAGDRGAALKAYGECQQVLAEELDVEPLADTALLAEAIRQGKPAEHIVRLLGPDLPVDLDSAALLPRGVPNNLRSQLTSFVGRQPEIAEIVGLVSANRLVTLVGPGGAGKSRLALEAAGRVLSELERPGAPAASRGAALFSDGVWWIDFVAIEDPALVPQTACTALGLGEQPGLPPSDALKQEAGSQSMLLVFDNAEHVAAACGTLAEQLLGAGSGVRVLATSREPLGVAGELPWLVPPLTAPPDAIGGDIGEVVEFEAPALFLDRAHLHDPRFEIADSDAPVLASLSRRLDGIPLAVELAAAQVGTLSVAQIAEHLDDRLQLLTSGSSSLQPRHQAMRAVIEWSHETLSVPEQVLLRRAAVFRGGWTADAADAVCSGNGIDSEYVSVLLSSLVARSLVDAATRDGVRRYRMLATTRQYAAEELARSGEEDAVRRRHLEYLVALSEHAEPELRGPEQATWMSRLAAEHNNIRTALSWAIPREGESGAALRLAGALRLFWYIRGHLAEGRQWLERSLEACPDPQPGAQAKALNGVGIIAYRQGDFAAARLAYEACIEAYRRAGDEHGVGLVLGNLGMVATDEGDFDTGRELFERSLAVLEDRGDERGMANALGNLGTVASEQGDMEAARSFHERSLELERKLEDDWGVAAALHSLGRLAADRGDLTEARSLFEEALHGYRAMGDEGSIAEALCDLGIIALRQQDAELAARYLDEACTLLRDTGSERHLAAALQYAGRAQIRKGRLRRAEEMLTESLALDECFDDARSTCLGLETLGELCAAKGEPERAALLWGAAQAVIDEMGPSWQHDAATDHELFVSAARSDLGDAAFEDAWRRGESMSVEEAVEYAIGDRQALAT